MGGGSRQSTGSGPGRLTEAPCQQEAEEAEEAASGRECLTHGGENEPRLPYLFTGVWKKGFSLWIKEAF